MAKTKISEWSATPASNTDIDGINISEGCAPSGINDAIREMMAQVKDLYSGTTGDAIAIAGGGTGATTASAARTALGVAIGTDVQTYSANLTAYAATGIGFRNRIINGDMRIDQRNNGASVTPTGYALDRWTFDLSQASKLTTQQNAGSVTPPAGFSKYLGIVSSSAYVVGATDYFVVKQVVEGFNISDFGWGAAGAQPVTLSFWVRSSLTGTFGGVVGNGNNTRAYPFTYAVSAANTWEQKTITVSGDVTGTWATDNTAGLELNFGLGVGSTYSASAGAWAAGNFLSATGATSVVGTSGATFYITGVQLEAGTVATPFERRDYGRELMMCQRYYQGTQQYFALKVASGYARVSFTFPVMRTAPTVTYADDVGTANRISTFTSADVRTDNRTPIAVIGGNTGAFFVLPNNTDADIAFTVIASLSSEL